MTRVRHLILDALVVVWTGLAISYLVIKWCNRRQKDEMPKVILESERDRQK